MKRRLLALAAVVAVLAPTPGEAAVDHPYADTRPCVTPGEWRDLRMGMTRAEIRGLLDVRGRYLSVSDAYAYRVCNVRPSDGLVLVRYRGGRVWQAFRFDLSAL